MKLSGMIHFISDFHTNTIQQSKGLRILVPALFAAALIDSQLFCHLTASREQSDKDRRYAGRSIDTVWRALAQG